MPCLPGVHALLMPAYAVSPIPQPWRAFVCSVDTVGGIMRLGLLLLVAALQACATTAARDATTYIPTAAWEAAHHNEEECEDAEEDACVTPACTAAGCGLYRCEDLAPGRIIQARGASAVRPPANSQRYWGDSQVLPGDAQPVFIFQWYRPEEPPSQKEAARRLELWRQRPHERHHIFPQAHEGYFVARGINIHEWTLVLDAAEHARVHRLKDRGPWNTEWKAWLQLHWPEVTKAVLFEFASYLIRKHNLWGMPATYWQPFELPPLPPGP
jgi:uncharacterized lipoprotein (TIGR02269 family)